MFKVDSLKSWFRQTKLWDTFFAYCHGGLEAVRSVLSEIVTFRLPEKPAKKRKSFQPTVEQLEGRVVPATYTWDGGGPDNHWNTALNWSSHVVPGSSDDAVIDSNLDVVLVSDVQVGNLTISAGLVCKSGNI